MIELFNREVEEAEAKFRKNSSFVLSPEIIFNRVLPTPEVNVTSPEIAAVDRLTDDPIGEPSTKIGNSIIFLNTKDVFCCLGLR